MELSWILRGWISADLESSALRFIPRGDSVKVESILEATS